MKVEDSCLFVFTDSEGRRIFNVVDVADAESHPIPDGVAVDVYLYKGENVYSEKAKKPKKVPDVKAINDARKAAKKKPKDPPIPQDE